MEKNIKTLFLLTGPNGGGKGTTTDILKAKLFGIVCYEMRTEIEMIAKEEDHMVFTNRDQFTDYTKMQRILHGPDIFMKRVLDKIPKTPFAIVDSMRHPAEYECALQYADRVCIIAVLPCPLDASKEVQDAADRKRYEYLQARKSVTDTFQSFEEFLAKDKTEWRPTDPNDPNAHNVEACVNLAIGGVGFVVINDGNIPSLRGVVINKLLQRQLATVF